MLSKATYEVDAILPGNYAVVSTRAGHRKRSLHFPPLINQVIAPYVKAVLLHCGCVGLNFPSSDIEISAWQKQHNKVLGLQSTSH